MCVSRFMRGTTPRPPPALLALSITTTRGNVFARVRQIKDAHLGAVKARHAAETERDRLKVAEATLEVAYDGRSPTRAGLLQGRRGASETRKSEGHE